MVYETWVVDECGYEVCRVSDLSADELNEMMDNHPEWTTRTLCLD